MTRIVRSDHVGRYLLIFSSQITRSFFASSRTSRCRICARKTSFSSIRILCEWLTHSTTPRRSTIYSSVIQRIELGCIWQNFTATSRVLLACDTVVPCLSRKRFCARSANYLVSFCCMSCGCLGIQQFRVLFNGNSTDTFVLVDDRIEVAAIICRRVVSKRRLVTHLGLVIVINVRFVHHLGGGRVIELLLVLVFVIVFRVTILMLINRVGDILQLRIYVLHVLKLLRLHQIHVNYVVRILHIGSSVWLLLIKTIYVDFGTSWICCGAIKLTISDGWASRQILLALMLHDHHIDSFLRILKVEIEVFWLF